MQNPPPGEQGTGSSYGAPPPQSGQKSGTGLDPNLAAALSYIWIVGLIFFIIEKENRFIRFHALQSVIYGVLWIVVVIVLVVINIIVAVLTGVAAGAAGDAGALVGLLVSLIAMLIWLVLLITPVSPVGLPQMIQDSGAWLGAMQGFVTAALGVFYVKKK